MKMIKLFGKKTDVTPPKIENDKDEIYSGMRVEVTTFDGRMLFVAKLMGLNGNQAELHQYSEAAISQEEPFPVKIRGYSDRDRKAVNMEGVIAPLPQNKWSVTELKICQFLELTEADQDQISQSIFVAQRIHGKINFLKKDPPKDGS